MPAVLAAPGVSLAYRAVAVTDATPNNLIDGPGQNLYDGLARAFARVLVLLQVELVLLLVSARVQPV